MKIPKFSSTSPVDSLTINEKYIHTFTQKYFILQLLKRKSLSPEQH